MALLEAHALTAGYGPIVALRDLDLTVEPGEIVALLGANGAGKTTTLMALAGMNRQATGRVTFKGEEVLGHAPEALVSRGLCLVPEGRRIFGRLSVAENLLMGAAGGGRKGPEVAADRDRLLARFPVLERRYEALASELSGGEQQQLAIARGLMARPTLLLLDEPSLGLAPKLIAAMFELIAELRRDDGMTILVVEQNVHQALDVCDRGYVLRSGRCEMQGTPAELRRRGLERAYLGIPDEMPPSSDGREVAKA
ncbi:MAG: ABC transporter ATP-binding protein [Solirubrobacteraceae bacterium]